MDSITDDPSIIEAHRKIANFAIDTYGPNPPYSDLQLSRMKYRYSWDWLNHVWCKILASIIETYMNKFDEDTAFGNEISTWRSHYHAAIDRNDISGAFCAVTFAIDWYNQTKEKQTV